MSKFSLLNTIFNGSGIKINKVEIFENNILQVCNTIVLCSIIYEHILPTPNNFKIITFL